MPFCDRRSRRTGLAGELAEGKGVEEAEGEEEEGFGSGVVSKRRRKASSSPDRRYA